MFACEKLHCLVCFFIISSTSSLEWSDAISTTDLFFLGTYGTSIAFSENPNWLEYSGLFLSIKQAGISFLRMVAITQMIYTQIIFRSNQRNTIVQFLIVKFHLVWQPIAESISAYNFIPYLSSLNFRYCLNGHFSWKPAIIINNHVLSHWIKQRSFFMNIYKISLIDPSFTQSTTRCSYGIIKPQWI